MHSHLVKWLGIEDRADWITRVWSTSTSEVREWDDQEPADDQITFGAGLAGQGCDLDRCARREARVVDVEHCLIMMYIIYKSVVYKHKIKLLLH